ncbi:MAG: EamA family transporter [Lachnospiraceae bacterium]|nr:EamA family transporter [Lachnospiraceae bacterium]
MNMINNESARKPKLGLLAVIIGDTIFGFSFLFSKLLLGMVTPSEMIAIRFIIAFIVLNIIVLVNKLLGDKALFTFSLKDKPIKPLLKLAICQPCIYFIAESYGIKFTSSSFAGIIIALVPIAGILADVIFVKAKILKIQIFCALLSVAGVALTTIGASGLKSSTIGLALLIVAVISGSMFYVFSKDAGKYYNPLERTYAMFMIGSIVYSIPAAFDIVRKPNALITAFGNPVFYGCMAYLAVISSVVAFMLLNFASNHVTVTSATLVANLTTVISIFAGVVFLHESLTVLQIVGAVIIIGSVTIGTLKNQ